MSRQNKDASLLFDNPEIKQQITDRTKVLELEYKKMNKQQLLSVAAANSARTDALFVVVDHMAGTITEQQQFFKVLSAIMDTVINGFPVTNEMREALTEMYKHFKYLTK
jgi:hypothetical protein